MAWKAEQKNKKAAKKEGEKRKKEEEKVKREEQRVKEEELMSGGMTVGPVSNPQYTSGRGGVRGRGL